MKETSTLKVSAQLWKLTTLQTVKDNNTQWTLVFERTKELGAIQDLHPLLPVFVEVDVLEKSYIHLKKFHQINMMLQKEAILFVRKSSTTLKWCYGRSLTDE
jgi:hypothetical protein